MRTVARGADDTLLILALRPCLVAMLCLCYDKLLKQSGVVCIKGVTRNGLVVLLQRHEGLVLGHFGHGGGGLKSRGEKKHERGRGGLLSKAKIWSARQSSVFVTCDHSLIQ
jgi:hypothetical protein